MKGAHSVKKNNKKSAVEKKSKISGATLKVDPNIIQATIAPKAPSEPEEKASEAFNRGRHSRAKEYEAISEQAPTEEAPNEFMSGVQLEPQSQLSARVTSSKADKQKKFPGKQILIAVVVVLLIAAIVAFATQAIQLPFGGEGTNSTQTSANNSASQSGDTAQSNQDNVAQEENPQITLTESLAPSGTYTNERFGFSVVIPDGFLIDSEFDNGSGIMLVNDSLDMVVRVSGSNNIEGFSAREVLDSLWNKDDDSIARTEDNRVIIYQYDEVNEYFYWIFVGDNSINQMQIEYPVQDNNQEELDAAQVLMRGFTPGNINSTHQIKTNVCDDCNRQVIPGLRMEYSRRTFLKLCGSITAAAVTSVACAGCAKDEPEPEVPARDIIKEIINGMSVEQKAAQLFVVTTKQISGVDQGSETIEAMQEGLKARPVSGLIFFTANLKDASQTTILLHDIQAISAAQNFPPFFLCVDEEGGEVQRIGGRDGFDLPVIPHASNIGATGDAETAAGYARTIASSLRNLGFNVDFAPSCEIAYSSKSNMYRRSFGADAELVSDMVTAQIKAFAQENMLCCAKHFPGIGDPEEDSHNQAISSNKTREELAEQLIPFKAAINAGVPFVMMGHLALPQITGTAIPASISPDIVTGILRESLGYDGIVITDSLSMKALSDFCPPRDVAVAAINAGCDLALMPADFNAAYDGLVDAITTERIPMERIDQSLTRILACKLAAFPEYEKSLLEFEG